MEKEARKAVWSRYQQPRNSWIARNPRVFSALALTTGLLIFFSKPLYDTIVTPSYKALEKPTE